VREPLAIGPIGPIGAIAEDQQATGCSVKDAKADVDNVEAQLHAIE
jgi:hypothetical protein